MSLLTRLVPGFLRSGSMAMCAPSTSVVPVMNITQSLTETVKSFAFFGQSIRTVIRCHFPRPSERKRIKRHGYKKRMSTPEGRRILMRKILKGCFVLSH
ncbi:large ribosomal subunit protein bL34m [Atheta coriaria]|uniref:large ribosomal subunit protein bL34m n=1 Tax=Dalotia coriaria TaxID=877792 RepID=UPI0031F387BA